MRIESIALKNFGSYRDASVDLADISAAVVLGPNGAGKSTLCIDAILWALYGEARSDTDHMIRTGTIDMMASLTFRLNQARYRVIRKRSLKTKAGKSDLELQLESGQDTTGCSIWTSISGARLLDTQQKILQLLNFDRSLLTASAFLVQGQADRFTRATPAERKAILAGIEATLAVLGCLGRNGRLDGGNLPWRWRRLFLPVRSIPGRAFSKAPRKNFYSTACLVGGAASRARAPAAGRLKCP